MDKEILIQKYLHGTISDDELDTLLLAIEADKTFAEQLEIESVFYAKRNIQLKKELSELKSKSDSINKFKEERKLRTRKFQTLKPVLFLVLLALPLLAYFIIQNSNTQNQQNLVSQFLAVPFEAPPSLMNDDEVGKDIWALAQNAYKKDDFNLAASLISSIDERTEQQELYLGLSYLFDKERNLKQSMHSFDIVMNTQKGSFKDIAEWYAALNYSEQGLDQKAIDLLEKIVNSKSWNHIKAKLLLSELN